MNCTTVDIVMGHSEPGVLGWVQCPGGVDAVLSFFALVSLSLLPVLLLRLPFFFFNGFIPFFSFWPKAYWQTQTG